MKQRTEKLLAMLITLAMCMGLMSMPVMADGYAAKIGDAEYATVQEAIGAAQENEEIVVYDATTFPSTLTLSNATIKGAEGASKVKVTTLSTISASNQNLRIENFEFEQSSSTGKLVMSGTGMTIKNCDFVIGATHTADGGLTTISGAKNLCLENCNFDGTAPNNARTYLISSPSCENLTIKGCRMENGWSATHYGILSGDVLVEDSYIVEEAYTVHNGGDSHVNSYTIKNSTLGGWTSYAWCDQATFENCTFVDFSYNTLVAYNNTTFKNCTFPAGYQIYAGSTSSFNWVIDNCTVGGELLYEGDEEKFFASDDTAWKNQTVTITPSKATVAQIGNTKYATLAQAVANVKSGETITLLQNAYGDGIIVPENSNFTLDFAGYTYDVDGDKLAGSTGTQTQAFQLLKGSNITFKNGTVTSSKAKMLIQNYCNLTLDNMILDGTKLVGNAPCTLSNNNGNVTIKDTAINAKSGGFAFDVYSFKPYTGANVTVDGGTINGNIEIDAKPDADTTNLGLTINGGKFTGTFNPTIYGGKFKVTGGIFTADVNAYVADGYTLRAIDDTVYNYEVVKATTADKDYVADETGAQTAQEIAVSKVEKDLVNNGDSSTVVTAQKKTVSNEVTKVFNIVTVEKSNDKVSATATKPIAVTGTENVISVDNITLSALGELFAQKVEVLNAVAEPTATLSLSVATETTTDDAITYEVHPVVTVADNSYPLNGNVVDGKYTFRLTVPEKMAKAYNKIKVAHGNEVQYCDVKSDEKGSYIEVKTTHFSTFEVTGVIGISAIDAYIDPQTSNGNIRFLTTVNSADTVSEYGTYFALDTVGIENSNVNRKATDAGTAFDFDVDILNVPQAGIDKTFYAISYVKIGDDTVWSVAVPASVAQYKHN